MATWNFGFCWTPALARELANLLDVHSGRPLDSPWPLESLRTVANLRKSANRNTDGRVLGSRAEHAYEETMGELEDSAREKCADAVRAFLARVPYCPPHRHGGRQG